MAQHDSALKQHRQSLKHRVLNRRNRARARTAVKKFRKLLAAGALDLAKEMLPSTVSMVDRAAKQGVIHRNAASRTKSRLSRALARASAG